MPRPGFLWLHIEVGTGRFPEIQSSWILGFTFTTENFAKPLKFALVAFLRRENFHLQLSVRFYSGEKAAHLSVSRFQKTPSLLRFQGFNIEKKMGCTEITAAALVGKNREWDF